MWAIGFQITLAEASDMLWSEFLEWWSYAWPSVQERARENDELREQAKQLKREAAKHEKQNTILSATEINIEEL